MYKRTRFVFHQCGKRMTTECRNCKISMTEETAVFAECPGDFLFLLGCLGEMEEGNFRKMYLLCKFHIFLLHNSI